MDETDKKLSEDQQDLFDKIINRKISLFFTGCAGTGKTFLLKKIISHYIEHSNNPGSIAITASTGRAAFSIGGTTLHSFVGVGLGIEPVEQLIQKLRFNKKAFRRWKDVQLLVIDEVSMLDATYFDKVEIIARSIRNNKKPFGGVQVILTGDLLQLPPVSEGSIPKKRIFEGEAWSKCIKECIALHDVFRQSDEDFVRILTAIRVGVPTEEVINFMNSVSREIQYDSESGPVNLYATRAMTEQYNQGRLSEINSDTVVYQSNDQYPKSNKSAANMLDSCPAPSILEVKIGAQVMLIKNLTKDLVNGTVGIITKFVSQKNFLNEIDSSLESIPVVRFTLADGRVFTRPLKREVWESKLPTGEVVASRSQIPLILAWAVTIHKSQGQTIQRLKVDLSNIFESGQVYTAISRAVSPETLEVTGFNPDRISADQVSLKFCIEHDII